MKKHTSLILILSTILFLSFASNPPQGNTGAPFDRSCARSGCHSNTSSISGKVSITGIPNEVQPGETYPFKVVLEVTRGNATRGGFQMVATDASGNDIGQISSAGSNSTTSSFQGRTYFEHDPAKSFGGNKIEYTASWTAPESGSVTFYTGAMFVNGNGSPSGDTFKKNEATFTVAVSNALAADVSILSDVACNGESTGSATAEGSGGSGEYTYTWDNGESGKTATALSAGNHNVTISDGLSQVVLALSIVEPAPVEVGLSTTSSIECAGDESGNLSAEAVGGTPPYSFVWSNGSVTQKIDNIAPGIYSVTVTDANQCNGLSDISLFAVDNIPPSLSTVESIELVLAADGSFLEINDLNDIVMSTSDNCDTDLSIDWSPKRFDCENVGNNILTIIASDKSGNSTSATVQVKIVDNTIPLIACITGTLRIATCASFTYTQPSVMDNCSNTRLELASGIGINGSFPIGETRDIYMVTDASGNTATCEIIIINEPTIVASTDVTQISCAGESDGSVQIDVSGSNAPFTIDISNSNSNQNLAGGVYTYIVTDFTGCSLTGEFEIVEPKALAFKDNQATRPTTTNSGDGAIEISILGGTSPYTYSWMVGDEFFSDKEDLTMLFPGMYTVKVKDSRGCEITSGVFILEEVTAINDPIISSKVSTFPNPANEFFRVKINDLPFSNGTVSIYNTSGKMIMHKSELSKEDYIATSALENGVYVIKIVLDKELVIRPILVQH
ncbi:MAG: choice-of-anchor V domain-containing protein [Saprospiraceae bacterium]